MNTTSAKLHRRLSEFHRRKEREQRRDPFARTRELWDRDVREFGVQVTRLSKTRLELLELLSFTVPSIARPHCCYINTVIFYHHPHQISPDGRAFIEWGRCEYLLPWNTIFLFDGQQYESGAGRVIRHRKAWYMTHSARARSPLSTSALCVPPSAFP